MLGPLIYPIKILVLGFCISSTIIVSRGEIIEFEHFETQHGLGIVSVIYRDHEGYLWVGGQENLGLIRFDGTEEKYYYREHDNPASLSDSLVKCIIEDSRKTLWVGTRNGLNRYDRTTDSFIHYRSKKDEQTTLLRDNIIQIHEDNQQRLWIVTPAGVNQYFSEDDCFLRYPLTTTNIRQHQLTGIASDLDGEIWVVGYQNGILHFDPLSKNYEWIQDTSYKNEEKSKKVYVDSSNNIWIVSAGQGLAKFNKKTRSFKHYPVEGKGVGTSSGMIWDIWEYPKGQLLLAINQGGLNKFNIKEETFTYQNANDRNRGKISGNGATALFVDEESIIWLGTSRDGIDYSNPKKSRFSTYMRDPWLSGYGLVDNVVGCFLEDSDGLLWIGTDGGGISIWDFESKTFVSVLDDQNGGILKSGVVRSISEDADGRIWVCSWGNGITILEKTTEGIVRYTEKDHLIKKFDERMLWSCHVDSMMRVWLTTPKGEIFLYDDQVSFISKYFEGNQEKTSNSPKIFEKDGVITLYNRNGYFQFVDVETGFKKILDLPRQNVLKKSPDNLIYSGTVYRGVQVYQEDGTFLKSIGKKEGLSDDYIASLEFDDEGMVWIATRAGLDVYDPDSGKITHYNSSDGIQKKLFFGQSSLKLKSGELCFGGNDGMTLFNPKNTEINTYVPGVYVNRVNINHREIDHRRKDAVFSVSPKSLKKLDLSWSQNTFDFYFSAINFTYPQKNQYAYKLIGFDEDWHYTDFSDRIASYTNIPPGKYTFHVIGSNNDSIWNKTGSSFDVMIYPPFWRTSIFYVLCSVVLAFMFIVLLRFRERKLRTDKVILESKVNERTRTIEDQKNELEAQGEELLKHRDRLEFIVNERTRELLEAKNKAEHSDLLKTRFIANLSHEIRTPLNAIIGLTSFLNDSDLQPEEKEEYQRSIENNSDSLLQLIEDILDFSKIESQQIKVHDNDISLNDLMNGLLLFAKSKKKEDVVRVEMSNELESFNLIIKTDLKRLKQVMNNLIVNALKFANKGTITIGAKRENSFIKLYVSDEGPGIPKAHRHSIFEEFVKLEKDERLAKRGIGLGLAISKRLVLLLEGHLELESEEGKGTTFIVSFPETIIHTSGKTQEPKTSSIDFSKWKGKRFLVIEDEHSNYLYLSTALKRHGGIVDWAENGKKGVDAVRHNDYDLVFVDIQMPVMDGIEALRHIRQIRPSLKVVSQTAYALISDKLRIEDARFDASLWKPISITELYSLVDSLL